jgi:hypothetical protein
MPKTPGLGTDEGDILDTEGHASRPEEDEAEDAEGQMLRPTLAETEDDTEGHMQKK